MKTFKYEFEVDDNFEKYEFVTDDDFEKNDCNDCPFYATDKYDDMVYQYCFIKADEENCPLVEVRNE